MVFTFLKLFLYEYEIKNNFQEMFLNQLKSSVANNFELSHIENGENGVESTPRYKVKDYTKDLLSCKSIDDYDNRPDNRTGLPPRVDFINILLTHFLYKILAPKITKLCFGFEIFGAKVSYQKHAHITLMKLTAVHKMFYTVCKRYR